MASNSSNIGLLGGTFDPVHNGHVSIARSFADSDFIDELWVLLTPAPPHKSHQVATYRHRKTMLKLAFEDQDDIFISDVESSLPEPSYTIQTLEYLKKKYPEVKFYWCIGEDSLVNFTSWYKWQDILKNVLLLVASRPDVDKKKPASISTSKIRWVDHQPMDISSTELRNKLKKGETADSLVPPKVASYIQKNKLYQ